MGNGTKYGLARRRDDKPSVPVVVVRAGYG